MTVPTIDLAASGAPTDDDGADVVSSTPIIAAARTRETAGDPPIRAPWPSWSTRVAEPVARGEVSA